MLNSLMINYFNENIDDNGVALLFSGGTDSLTCLFSLLEVNIRPTLYSFHLEGVVHKDIEVSKKVAMYFDLPHVIVEIPKNTEQLKSDVIYLTQKMSLNRKSNIQCTYPFLHMMSYIKEDIVVSGLCADDLYGTSKSMSIKYANDKVGFDKARRKTLQNQYSSAYKPISDLFKSHNKTLLLPYRNESIIAFFMKHSWSELNKPKQKQIALNSYTKYFDDLNVYRRNTSLQVGSKIREWHNELLNTGLNKNNRKRVDEIYKDLYKEGEEAESRK